jgi:hypothetical protein
MPHSVLDRLTIDATPNAQRADRIFRLMIEDVVKRQCFLEPIRLFDLINQTINKLQNE